MIRLTKLNKTAFILNCELIEMFESTPDTVITLTNGKKYVVCETVNEVIQKVIQYKADILKNANISLNVVLKFI
jgi:flagellar protein FlbD